MKKFLGICLILALTLPAFSCKEPKPELNEVKESVAGVMFVLYFTSFAAEIGEPLEGVSLSVKEQGEAWEIRLKDYNVQEVYALRTEYFGGAPMAPAFSTMSGVFRIAPDNDAVSGDLKIYGGTIEDMAFNYDSVHFQKLKINGWDFQDEINQLIDTEGFLKQ